MTRLNAICNSDEECPDVSTILRQSGRAIPQTPRKGSKKEQGSRVPFETDDTKGTIKKTAIQENNVNVPRNDKKVSGNEKQVSRQRALGTVQINSMLLPRYDERTVESNSSKPCTSTHGVNDTRQLRSSPRKATKQPVNYEVFIPELSNTSGSQEESYDEDLSGFIVNDSASESEAVPVTLPRRTAQPIERFKRPVINDFSSDDDIPLRKSKKAIEQHSNVFTLAESPHLPFPGHSTSGRNPPSEVIDLTSPAKAVPTNACPLSTPERPSISIEPESFTDQNEDAAPAVLQYFPPRARSPHKILDDIRPITPPSSPSKPRLQSPSRRNRIPPSPHRPSIDAFWSQEVMNDWNDEYSPKKTPKGSRKLNLFSVGEDDEAELSPSESPRKSPSKSPKKDKRAIEQRKAFDAKKHGLAISFLKEIDDTTNGGKVAELAFSTGGIQIIWSKKLNSTAGRANWRREGCRSKNGDATVFTTGYRHHASIELAEKVIDDEDRLRNVIAHEYCHLANFMISGVKNSPHGKEFKEWAHKLTTAFSSQNIHVTTKHTYAIAYKYVWACTSCPAEFKRHSRSIDPVRHSCGSCKSRLIQVKPTPRVAQRKTQGEGEGEVRKKGGEEWKEFVKENFRRVRTEMGGEGVGVGEVVGALGREFRAMRVKGGSKDTEAVVIKDSDGDWGAGDGDGDGVGGKGMDDVARKLDFLKLG